MMIKKPSMDIAKIILSTKVDLMLEFTFCFQFKLKNKCSIFFQIQIETKKMVHVCVQFEFENGETVPIFF